jgi:pilus assembly protein CpaC
MIHALESNGLLRVLAEPNVVAASGQIASFLAGGEIPVPIASAGATGGTTVTVEWKEFGIKVRFLPTIVDSGVINLMVSPEVSSLDQSNAILLGGYVVPALRTRKAETTVELKDGESLVIGGLIMQEENNVRSRIPVLGHIPLLGYLFSKDDKRLTESELILTVSPRITYAFPRGVSVPLPGASLEEESAPQQQGE